MDVIEFKNVSFSYDTSAEPLIEGLDDPEAHDLLWYRNPHRRRMDLLHPAQVFSGGTRDV